MKISENSYVEHYSYQLWLLQWQYLARLMGADLQHYVVDQIYFISAVNKAGILDESPSWHSLYFCHNENGAKMSVYVSSISEAEKGFRYRLAGK